MDLERREETPNINNMNFDNITRCPDCNLISSLKFYYKEGKPVINYCCENNHSGDILLDEYLKKYNNHSLLKEKCQDCNKNQNEAQGEFYYCQICKKFICDQCLLNHPSYEKHNAINIRRYDSTCKNHYNSFSFYCSDCKKNICLYCKPEHKSHKLTELSEFNYSDESKSKLEDKIKNIEKKIQDLDIIKQDIINEIEKLKKSSETEIKFFKILTHTFKCEESQNNLNYNVIQNLKNFDEIFSQNKAQIYEKVYKEGMKYISFLQNIYQSIGQTNLFKNNFKTINNHSDIICHLSQLKDGRLISSSADSTLNIYKEDSFELQLSIKEHLSPICCFIQLQNDKIVTCSDDKTMNIIKLTSEDKYKLEQKLLGHNHHVLNVIEIRENELISVSLDKTMKKWEIKDDNKYECTKTITFQNSNSCCNILKLNENEFVTSSCSDKCLKFWNSNDYSNISTINNIEVEWTFRTLCMIDKDLLCVGGNNSKGFYLIKISTHQIIKNILGPQVIYSIYECFDGLFLCSIINENGNHSLVKYKYDNQDLKKIIEKEKAHGGSIYTCVELNDGTVASGGSDNLIKLWRN